MKWISVKECIPKGGDTVLCYNGSYHIAYCEEVRLGYGTLDSPFRNDIMFVGSKNEGYCQFLEVTHWMSLTEPEGL